MQPDSVETKNNTKQEEKIGENSIPPIKYDETEHNFIGKDSIPPVYETSKNETND